MPDAVQNFVQTMYILSHIYPLQHTVIAIRRQFKIRKNQEMDSQLIAVLFNCFVFPLKNTVYLQQGHGDRKSE